MKQKEPVWKEWQKFARLRDQFSFRDTRLISQSIAGSPIPDEHKTIGSYMVWRYQTKPKHAMFGFGCPPIKMLADLTGKRVVTVKRALQTLKKDGRPTGTLLRWYHVHIHNNDIVYFTINWTTLRILQELEDTKIKGLNLGDPQLQELMIKHGPEDFVLEYHRLKKEQVLSRAAQKDMDDEEMEDEMERSLRPSRRRRYHDDE